MYQILRSGSHARVRRLAAVGVFIALFSVSACGDEDPVRSSADGGPSAPAESSSPPEPSVTPTATPTPTPVVTTKTVTETEPIAFERVTEENPDMAAGTTEVTVAGVAGVRTFTYEIELTDGVETGRTLIDEEVTKKPVDEVTSVGTYEEPEPEPEPESDCDPNYSGCVPIDSDVDCAGGSGNGPSYVEGPVTVTGTDIYGLDSDGDGVGCES